mmetsp:Transcript_14041/g.26280  ORF Transcript_14041/g.26280 Transcript_14041/m.26280 type:complete len:410 (+) Transcript_14041:1-1230(+)
MERRLQRQQKLATLKANKNALSNPLDAPPDTLVDEYGTLSNSHRKFYTHPSQFESGGSLLCHHSQIITKSIPNLNNNGEGNSKPMISQSVTQSSSTSVAMVPPAENDYDYDDWSSPNNPAERMGARSSPTESSAAVFDLDGENYSVSDTHGETSMMAPIDMLTNGNEGREWTCVLSGVANGQPGFELTLKMSLKHYQRLVGYRIMFDGDKHGKTARILPPTDERTRMASATGKMEGTLVRQYNRLSVDPLADQQLVLSYGWRPNEDNIDGVGLENRWEQWVATLPDTEREDFTIGMTIEGSTANSIWPWVEYFPFGDLFGLESDVDIKKLEQKYSEGIGIVVVFHWDGMMEMHDHENALKEFAFFVPSSDVDCADAAVDTSIVARRIDRKPEANHQVECTSLSTSDILK